MPIKLNLNLDKPNVNLDDPKLQNKTLIFHSICYKGTRFRLNTGESVIQSWKRKISCIAWSTVINRHSINTLRIVGIYVVVTVLIFFNVSAQTRNPPHPGVVKHLLKNQRRNTFSPFQLQPVNSNISTSPLNNFVYPFSTLSADTCSQHTTFQSTYTQGSDDNTNDMIQSSDGNYVMVGSSTGGNTIGGTDAFILKVDTRGNPLWNRRIGGTGNDEFTRIRNTTDGGFIAIGYTLSLGESNGDVFLVKLTATGSVSWSAVFGNSSMFKPTACDVIETIDNGYAISANYPVYGDSSNMMIIKTSSTGVLQWNKRFYYHFVHSSGLVSVGDSLYVAGYYSSGYQMLFDGVLIKMNAITGQHYWTKTYDNGGLSDRIQTIHYSLNGFLLGFSHGTDNGYYTENSYARVDLNGNVQLAKMMNISQRNYVDRFIAPVSDSGVVCTLGNTYNLDADAEIIRFNRQGNTIFSRKFPKPGPQLMTNIIQLSDASFAISGKHTDLNTYPFGKAELIKTDLNGNTTGCDTDTLNITTSDYLLQVSAFTWPLIQSQYFTTNGFVTPIIKSDNVTSSQFCRTIICDSSSVSNCHETFGSWIGGAGDDVALDIHTTTDKGYILTGKTTSSSAGGNDGFIMKLNKKGSIQWSKTIGGAAEDVLSKIVQTSDGYIAIGTTASFGNLNGETFVVHSDFLGNLLWARHYSAGGVHGEKGKDIIQLTDGGFAFITNVNDSSVTGDGVITRTDMAGNIIWSKRFDNGNDDGFNTLMQDSNRIIVGGYTFTSDRDAILVKLNVSDGSVLSSTKYFNDSAWSDEMIHLDKINNGLSYTFRTSRSVAQYTYTKLSFFKERAGGNIFFNARASTVAYNKVNMISSVATSDSGFMYVYSDTSVPGNVRMLNFNEFVTSGWGKWNYQYGTHLYCVDRISDKGFAFAGYYTGYSTGFKSKINVYITDFLGNTGECAPYSNSEPVDTTHYTINPFQWVSIMSNAMQSMPAITPPVIDSHFSTNVLCSATVCDTIPPISDSCVSGTYLGYFGKHPNFFPDISTEIGSHYFLCGNLEWQPMIVKTKLNGDVEWAKTYNRYFHTFIFQRILVAPDNNLVLVGLTGDSSVIMKIDQNGTVIWAKSYKKYYESRIMDIIPADAGGFFVVLAEALGSGPTYTIVIKIDANGSFIWRREIQYYASTPIFRTMTFDGQNLYLAADDYANNRLMMLVKLDGQTGNYVWSKNFTFGTVGSPNPYVRSIYTIGDTIFAFYIITTPVGLFNSRYNLAMLKVLKTDGTLLNSVILNQPQFSAEVFKFFWSWHYPTELIKTIDNNFIFSNQAIYGLDTTLSMVCFNSSGVIQWLRNYPNLKNTGVFSLKQSGNNLLLVAHNYDYPSGDHGALIKTDLLGNIKATANSSAVCYGSLVTATAPVVYPFLEQPTRVNGSFVENIFTSSTFNLITRDIYFKADENCNEPANCNQLILSGRDTLCNLLDTVTYSITRNPGCTSPAFWQYDTSYVTITSTSDTTLKLLFRKSGITNISASINSGCNVITKTLTARIMLSPDSLNLGPDRAICGSSTFVLNARTGFKTYLWQDGSTDSLFTVTVPGTYYVSVKNYCNVVLRDTVVVSSGASLPLFIGNDTTICRRDSMILYANPGFVSYTWLPNYNMDNTFGSIVTVWPSVDTLYSVTAVQSNGCIMKDSIRISLYNIQPISLGNDTSICIGTSLQLNAGSGFVSYQWNNGLTGQQIAVSSVGSYRVVGTDNHGCKARDTINLLTLHIPAAIHLGNDTSLCAGDLLTLNAGNAFTSYLWSTGQIVNQIHVGTAASYWVDAIDSNQCHSRDTINILSILSKTPINLGNDTSFCQGRTLTLNAGSGFINYIWSTGAITQQIVVSSAGRYTVMATNPNSCISRDTLSITQLKPSPVVVLNKDSTLCEGSNRILDAGIGLSYMWQDGSTNELYTATGIGKYWVTVTNLYLCSSSDTAIISDLLPQPSNFLVKDTAVCEAQIITLRSLMPFSKYLWSTGSVSSQISISSPGRYWLQVTNASSCVGKEYVNVAPKNCIRAVYFPNAFTPNGDGHNDLFKATIFGLLKHFHLIVYNRFGERVFETFNTSVGWNGKYLGVDLDTDAFVWYCEYQFNNEQPKTQRGSVVLVR